MTDVPVLAGALALEIVLWVTVLVTLKDDARWAGLLVCGVMVALFVGALMKAVLP